MKPTTLEEALSMVPTHWLLIPGVDVPRKGGDEIRVESRREWLPVEDMLWDFERAYEHGVIARRPIPQDVREAEALWYLQNTLTLTMKDEPLRAWMVVLRSLTNEQFAKIKTKFPCPLMQWILAGKP